MFHRTCLLVLLLSACVYDPPPGTNIGALRKPDPDPLLPTDTLSLDFVAAVEEAIGLAGIATLATGWDGHVAAMTNATSSCPTVWVGPLPEEVDIDLDEDDPGLSWASECFASTSGASFSGFLHWSSALAEPEGVRTLVGVAEVTAGNGAVLYAFDGAAADTLDESSGAYTSTFEGEVSGSLVGLGSGLQGGSSSTFGLRTGGEFAVSWSGDALTIDGSLTMLEGFGPPDTRDPATSPELDNIPFTPGMPRFTSAVFDLEFDADCAAEPLGYVGLRGNEGYWFDVYFLPKYDAAEDFSSANAFPFEEIDNIACDGIGTLFARNVSLTETDEADPNWSREVAPNFAAVLAALPTPNLDAYVYTLRDLPLE